MAGLLGSLLTVFAPLPSFAQSSTATTILTIGDSICHGAIGDRPWRFNLQQHLVASGVTFDFVGEHSEGYNGDIDPSRPTYPATTVDWDSDTSCYWGRPAFNEQAWIAERVRNANPDYVLMMLGTNDITLLRSAVDASYYAKLAINNALDTNPDMKMVVGGIPPSGWFGLIESPLGIEAGSLVRDYNNQLREHIALLQYNPSYRNRVVFVDTFSGSWTVGDDTYDGTHPSPAGYDKIAEQFAFGLSQFGLGNEVYTSPSVEPSPRPAAPRNLRATPGPETAKLEWTPSGEGNGYRVFQSVDGGPFEMVRFDLARNKSSEMMELLDPEKTYRYYLQSEYAVPVDGFDPNNPGSVRQVIIDNVGPRSAIIEVRALPAQPLPPVTGLTAEAGVDSVHLKWNPVANVRDYRVYRSVNYGPFEPISWGSTDSSILVPAEGTSNTYQFEVEVSIGTRVSSRVQTDRIRSLPRPNRPAAPELLRSGIGAVAFWEEIPGAAGYELQRKDNAGGEWADVYYGTDLSNIQRPLVLGVTYSYRVRAVLPFFYYTRWSRPAEITISPGRAPQPPENLRGTTDGTSTSAWLNWDHSEMADEYQVLMSTQRNGTYRTVSYNSGLSARYIYGLEPDTTYFFRVKALSNQIGELGTTAPIALRTEALFPGLDCTTPLAGGLYEVQRYRLRADTPTYEVTSLKVPEHSCESEASGTLRYQQGKEYTVHVVAGPFAYIREADAYVRLNDLIPVDPLPNFQRCPTAQATSRPGSVFGMKVRGNRARVVNENCEVIGYLDKGHEISSGNIGDQIRGGYVEKTAGMGESGWIPLSDLEVVPPEPDASHDMVGSWGFCGEFGAAIVGGVSAQRCYFMNRDEEMIAADALSASGGVQAGIGGSVVVATSNISNLSAHGGFAACQNVTVGAGGGFHIASCRSLWDGYWTSYAGIASGGEVSFAAAIAHTEVSEVRGEYERRWVKVEICNDVALDIYIRQNIDLPNDNVVPPFC